MASASGRSEFHVGLDQQPALEPVVADLAVEVHQGDAGSSDVSFDLALVGSPAP